MGEDMRRADREAAALAAAETRLAGERVCVLTALEERDPDAAAHARPRLPLHLWAASLADVALP